MTEPSKEQIIFWRNDPNNWKFGLLYYNKLDPRFVVDKPNPAMGITFNFAQKKAYLFLIAMFSFFGFVVFFILINSKN